MNVVNVVPMSHTMPETQVGVPHVSVMAREVVNLMQPAGATLLDLTVGAGGHSAALLEAGAASVIGLDRDPRALELARARLERFGERALVRHASFSTFEEVLDLLGLETVDGLLADLGVSSMQLDEPHRGMSFRAEGPLDMRMDTTRGETALELLARVDDEGLTEILAKLGEERRARRVARCIKQELEAGKLETTLDLRRAVVRAVGPARIGGVDPATKTFQAIRMAVNRELFELEGLLEAAARRVRPGGRLAILTFHSLEDRMVKRALQTDAWEPLTSKPLVAEEDELSHNPRARSAKLRVARRREVSR
ncbi:MAG: 16S rRNA (cytosine(1402)-N(4))-methyltransferase RsmH [Deltaproteobacteria bacterium]|nr:16S rRNA (cytosine(1402)-N(4))-methyltransferase RsmH [Deltaproteobacteria bacterium]